MIEDPKGLIYLPDFPDYGISKDGRIWSKQRMVNRNQHKKADGSWPLLKVGGIWLKPSHDKDGYQRVGMTNINGVRKMIRVAIAVCRAYHGEKPKPEYVVCHAKGTNKSDCRAEILRWDTQQANLGPDKLADGTDNRGSRHFDAKLDEDEVIEIVKLIKEGAKNKIIAEKYKVTRSCIYDIRRGKSWGWLTGISFKQK